MTSPCRSRSSPVLTTTVRREPRWACSPCASFAPPTPPASSTSPRSGIAQGSLDLGHAVNRLAVVRRGHPADHRFEAHLPKRLDLLRDGIRRTEQMGQVARVLAPVDPHELAERGLGCLLAVADDDREADGQLDRAEVAPDGHAVLLEPVELAADLVDPAGR